MIRGLFINNKKAKDSIYESGFMVYECLRRSSTYVLDYVEIDIDNRTIQKGYDFYFFNYHPVTMGWLETRHLKKNPGFVITMILEVAPGDAFILCPEDDFNLYCALDPTIKSRKNLYSFPRPLEIINYELPLLQNEIPVIGSFGFATEGKGFHHVVEAVNKEFENAVVKINIPYGDFVPDSEAKAKYLGNLCMEIAKPGIDVVITHEFMSKKELINWCAGNDLNCFLYDRNMPGLSATTDQAIITGRPLAVSNNDTFRHITAYLPPYPKYSLKESMIRSAAVVNQMKKDWSAQNFVKKFEDILSENKVIPLNNNTNELFDLPVFKKTFSTVINSRLKKYKRKFKKALNI